MADLTETVKDVNFPALMDRLLGLLTEKEQNIIKRRFSLGINERETLDRIGQSYSITRERVRQIESVAIKKLARISMDPHMQLVHDLAYHILKENGGVLLEEHLLEKLFFYLETDTKIDSNALRLAMRVSTRFMAHEKTNTTRAFWRISELSLLTFREVSESIVRLLKKQQDEVLMTETIQELLSDTKIDTTLVASILEIDLRFMKTKGGWGLSSCRLINPKSIRDRIMIVLRNNKKPLHFRSIIASVHEDFPKRKSVTPQAIHNELIRHDDFVLVGRGEYGLKEWGMVSGTVCDVIIKVLEENDGPMKRKQIIDEVLKKREIRVGTISLNLQKYEFFKRVGRAVYEYVPQLDNRRRNTKTIR